MFYHKKGKSTFGTESAPIGTIGTAPIGAIGTAPTDEAPIGTAADEAAADETTAAA